MGPDERRLHIDTCRGCTGTADVLEVNIMEGDVLARHPVAALETHGHRRHRRAPDVPESDVADLHSRWGLLGDCR